MRTKYNKRYKEIKKEEGSLIYLRKENLDRLRMGKRVRTLAKLKCENMIKMNKYWKEKADKICIFFAGKIV